MKWEMEMEIEEVEAVLEKIWDLHDKLSDAIHSVSRSHFLHSVKALRNSNDVFDRATGNNKKASDDDVKGGFVYVKDFPMEEDEESAIHEAKSLNSIRTALENLEDQLEFFHTVQTQQRAERDAAIARLEQSRVVLALRLAEHHGKKYKVIEEARAFVGEVQNHGKFAPVENGYSSAQSPSGNYVASNVEKRSNILVKVLISSFNFAKKSLKVDHLGGVFGNAALFAVSMLALLHLHQVADRDRYISDLQQRHEVNNNPNKNVTKVYLPDGGSSSGLDVLLARG